MSKILIVEDEQDVLEVLKAGISRYGHDVAVARDGKEAIKKVKSFGPDLVVLDILLPEVSGLEVLKWIRKHASEVYVMLATAKKELTDFKVGYNLKADYYITKPYMLEEIAKGIDVLLSLKGGEGK